MDEALVEIKSLSGRQFDPALVDCFMRLAPELRRAHAAASPADAPAPVS